MDTMALKKVVQGKLHWRELQKCGVAVQHHAGRWTFGPTRGKAFHATAEDLTEGLRALLDQPELATEWASFILAAAGIIELDALESDELGDQLLECLWDLSKGDTEKARALLGTNG